MLKTAVKAQLPLIAVTTRDTLNLADVIHEITGRKPTSFKANAEIASKKLYLYTLPFGEKLPLFELYSRLVALESTLIISNPSTVIEPMFDAGEVQPPKPMLIKFLGEVVEDHEKALELSRSLGGCTLKEAAEFCRLTMARDSSLTFEGLNETRRTSFQGSAGLTQVNLRQDFYLAPENLAAFAKAEKKFFLDETDHRLIPRGLLFDGPPGTGKTAGAKHLAETWGVPLYRFDIGGTKNKYVGESEGNMLTNLRRLDNEEPCVVLLDEVEKVLSSSINDTSGTTTTLMSQLLWWLAEHRSRVFTVLTTNNAKALPKELYREGRIDETMWFGGLGKADAQVFVGKVLATFKKDETVKAHAEIVKATVPIPETNPPAYSQASLTKAVYAYVKGALKPSATLTIVK